MKNGETRSGPRSSSSRCSRSMTSKPPMPLPIITPTRVRSPESPSGRSRPRHRRRGQRELDEAPAFLDFFLLDPLQRIEAFHFAGEPRRVARRIEHAYRPDPRLSGQDASQVARCRRRAARPVRCRSRRRGAEANGGPSPCASGSSKDCSSGRQNLIRECRIIDRARQHQRANHPGHRRQRFLLPGNW